VRSGGVEDEIPVILLSVAAGRWVCQETAMVRYVTVLRGQYALVHSR